MKRLLLILLLLSTPAYAYKITPSVGYGLDQVGVQASGDVSIKNANNGDVIYWSSVQNAWIVGAQSSSGGSSALGISKNGVFVVSANTVNFTTGFGVTNSGSIVTVSDNIATTTTPGIASFDATTFTVAPLGGVDIQALKDGSVRFINSVDGSKNFSFDLQNIGAGSGVTLNIQNLAGSVALNTNTLDFFTATSSSQLKSVISDEIGSGFLPFFTSTVSANGVVIGNPAGTGYDQPAIPNCADSIGKHLNFNTATNAWSCGTTSNTGIAGTIIVSANGSGIVSANTVNFTTGFNVTNSGAIATVSGAMATVNVPGIASFDNNYFRMLSFGGVSLTSGITASINAVTAVSHSAVTLAGASYLTLSGQQITAAVLPTSVSNNDSTMTITPTTGAVLVSLNTVAASKGGTGVSTIPSNGFIPIGNGTTYVSAALTASDNIAIVNGSGKASVGLSTNVVMVSSFVNKVVALTDAATIATDASLGNIFTVTLGGARTLGNPTNGTNGQKVVWRVSQDASGTRTLAYGNAFRFGSDVTSPTLSTTAGKIDYIGAIYNTGGPTASWDVVAVSKGYQT